MRVFSLVRISLKMISLANGSFCLHFSGDWTACESALKALERVALDEGGPKTPLATVSDNVS